MKGRIIGAAAIIGCMMFGFWLFFHYTVDRYYVPEGQSLLLRYKGPLVFGSRETAKQGHWAEEGEIGILQNLRGPGRHFYSPIWWERRLVPDMLIQPGEVGVVTCKLGDPLPQGQFLVDGEVGTTKQRGVLRKVLGPGRYRINPYGYDVQVVKNETTGDKAHPKVSGWVSIPTGYVGVVTNLAGNAATKQTAGIQDKVLPPGIYPTNPKEQQIDIVGVGYWETSIDIKSDKPFADLVRADESGKPVQANLGGGINFPSSDGFGIVMDFTAIWGLMPDQAPNAIRTFGNVDLVESKVVLPQIESICRNNGSEYSAVQLLVGEEREIFQNETVDEFRLVLDEKKINLLSGLVRHIYIPHEVRGPIQLSFISDELKLTREQEQLTAREEANLREAEKKVELEAARVVAETSKLVAAKAAEGQKVVGETTAETRQKVAAIAKVTAELKAQAELVLGKAQQEGKKLVAESEANKFKLAVEAFGTATAYNNWVFATGLPANIELKFLYAGPGTLWTDLKESVRINVPMTANGSPEKK